MSALYPDESYCTSELGRLIFYPKNEWAVTGKVVDAIEVKHIAGNHIEYKIEIKCIPRNSIELDDRIFTLNSRFRELNRLHGNLSKLHKQLYLRGIFPQFAAPRLLGSCDSQVVAERRRSIDDFLAFILNSEVLRKARVLHEWIDRAVEEAFLGQLATPSAFISEGVNIIDSRDILDTNNSSTEVLTPEILPPPEVQISESVAGLGASESDSDFRFTDVVLDSNDPLRKVCLSLQRSPTVIERLLPKLPSSKPEILKVLPSNESTDYLLRGAFLLSTAQRAEEEHAYELAFHCYKNAADCFIQGIQIESDISIRNALRRKAARYLVAAEQLYRTHLCYNGATAGEVDLKSLVELPLSDPDILAFQCANKSLKNYRVVGVLPSINSHKWVLKVEEKSTGRHFVMKLLEKGVKTSDSRVLVPTNVPHMVQLYHFFETETYIILVLEYVESGTLWGFLARYFNESEKRFLLSLAGKDNSSSDDVAKCSAFGTSLFESESNLSYRGRRLHFTVGVDFERVAQMHDESQSSDVPSTSITVCTMGEDATGDCRVPEGDFYLVGEEATDNVSLRSEETPTQVELSTKHDGGTVDDSFNQTLLESISSVRTYLRRERRRAWPECRVLPEPLIVHWMAQLVSWLYIMHSEHNEVIADLRPDNLLLDMNGNLLMSYYCRWHSGNKPKQIVEGYSAPECFKYDWVPCVENDLWTFAAILFELLSGRALVNAAPHGVTSSSELPFPDDIVISFAARDLLSRLLTDVALRPSLESIRAHAFFRTIDWSLYDNPHINCPKIEPASITSCSAFGIMSRGNTDAGVTGLPPYVPDLMDVAVDDSVEESFRFSSDYNL